MTESLGPIFAETAQTLGRRQANIGFSYTYLSLAKFRGLPTEDISFIFTHQETGQAPLGDDPSEQDLVGLALGLDVNAAILAFSGTYGVTDNFDLGIAVPVVHVGLKVDGTARVIQPSSAVITFHQFNKDPSDPLVDPVTRDESATGLGDIALRLKYSLQRGAGVDLAALLDVRLPTGSKENFFGTGKINTRLSWIMSKKLDNFTPHLNLSYARRSADFDSDQLEFTLGFDRKLANGFSVAAEFFGGFALNRDETIQLLPGTAPVTFSTGVRQVDLSNVPEWNRDNVLNAALGFRAAPTDKLSLLGNVIIALNDGGLRSSVVPTFGANLSF